MVQALVEVVRGEKEEDVVLRIQGGPNGFRREQELQRFLLSCRNRTDGSQHTGHGTVVCVTSFRHLPTIRYNETVQMPFCYELDS
jgi:hypothetical protein